LKAGVDVLIVTDHNVLVNDIEGYTQEGKRHLLLLVGEEVHDRTSPVGGNHMLIFGHNLELFPLCCQPPTADRPGALRRGFNIPGASI